MPIQFLIDENMPRAVHRAIARHNEGGCDLIHALQVGMTGAPPRRTEDQILLLWIEQSERILISYDKRTLPTHFANHLAAGNHVPGIFLFKEEHTFPFIAEFLALTAHASHPQEWRDRLLFIP